MLKKIVVLSVILEISILPALAKFSCVPSKNCFYNPNQTLMTEMSFQIDKNIETESFWKQNLLYFNKYTPLFMLSNTELYDLTPKENPTLENKAIDDVSLEKKVNDYLSEKNYPSAIKFLNDVTGKEPYNAYAFYLKGQVFLKQNDFENAMKNYVQALKINPLSQQCYLSIARILEPTNKKLSDKYYEKANME